MNTEPRYKKGQKVKVVADNGGYFHGIGDGRTVTINYSFPLPPLPGKSLYEYEVMDENGDFWHVPEIDLL